MNSSQNCNTTFLNHDRYAAVSAQHLMGRMAYNALDVGTRERLENFHWLVRIVHKGHTIVAQGSDHEVVSVLLSGLAFRHQTLNDGKRQILDFVCEGNLIGFGSGRFNNHGVEAVTDCRVATLAFAQFRQLLAICPALAVHVAERICDSEARAHDHMTSLGRRSARMRLARLLVELIERIRGHETAEPVNRMQLPVTQIMLGDALGLSNEHVCRLLGKLAKEGVISLSNHMLDVLDEAALMREAAIVPAIDGLQRKSIGNAA